MKVQVFKADEIIEYILLTSEVFLSLCCFLLSVLNGGRNTVGLFYTAKMKRMLY